MANYQQSDWYSTVFSNACLTLYPKNKCSSFTNNLQNGPVQVNPYTKCALTQISFTPSFENDESAATMEIFDFLSGSDAKGWGMRYIANLGKIKIDSPQSLVSVLNDVIWTHVDRLLVSKFEVFTYDSKLERIWVQFDPDSWINICCRGRILSLIGMLKKGGEHRQLGIFGKTKKPDSYIYKKETRVFKEEYKDLDLPSRCPIRDLFMYPPNYIRLTELLVYCNLTEYQYVADTRVNLLRTIPINMNSHGERVTLNFGKTAQYLRLLSPHINEIFIEIRDIYGNLIPKTEYIRCVLHFK